MKVKDKILKEIRNIGFKIVIILIIQSFVVLLFFIIKIDILRLLLFFCLLIIIEQFILHLIWFERLTNQTPSKPRKKWKKHINL